MSIATDIKAAMKDVATAFVGDSTVEICRLTSASGAGTRTRNTRETVSGRVCNVEFGAVFSEAGKLVRKDRAELRMAYTAITDPLKPNDWVYSGTDVWQVADQRPTGTGGILAYALTRESPLVVSAGTGGAP